MSVLVSIITVTYNVVNAGRKEFLCQCFESIHKQPYGNIEHIVIDGASTDGTLELIQKYAEKGWLTCYSEPDKGIYNAMNKGIEKANGEYIAFLNSDDYFINEHTVSTQVNVLLQSKCDFVCSDYEEIAEDCSVQIRMPRFKCFYLYNPFCHQTVLASKNMLLDLNGFNEKYKIYGDYDLLLRALLKGYCFSYIHQAMIGFRKGGVSSDFNAEKVLELEEIYKSNYKISEKKAQRLSQYGCLPYKLLKEILAKMNRFQYVEDVTHYNNVCLFKYYLKQFITLKFTKGKRLVKILGITLYDEAKKV